MRESGSVPQFGRIIRELERAREAWENGEPAVAIAGLNLAGTLALAEAAEAHRRLEANAVTRGRIVLEIPPVASRA